MSLPPTEAQRAPHHPLSCTNSSQKILAMIWQRREIGELRLADFLSKPLI
jgi:hypothetical protein